MSDFEYTLKDDDWKDSFDKLLDDRPRLRERKIIKKDVHASYNNNSSIFDSDNEARPAKRAVAKKKYLRAPEPKDAICDPKVEKFFAADRFSCALSPILPKSKESLARNMPTNKRNAVTKQMLLRLTTNVDAASTPQQLKQRLAVDRFSCAISPINAQIEVTANNSADPGDLYRPLIDYRLTEKSMQSILEDIVNSPQFVRPTGFRNHNRKSAPAAKAAKKAPKPRKAKSVNNETRASSPRSNDLCPLLANKEGRPNSYANRNQDSKITQHRVDKEKEVTKDTLGSEDARKPEENLKLSDDNHTEKRRRNRKYLSELFDRQHIVPPRCRGIRGVKSDSIISNKKAKSTVKGTKFVGGAIQDKGGNIEDDMSTARISSEADCLQAKESEKDFPEIEDHRESQSESIGTLTQKRNGKSESFLTSKKKRMDADNHLISLPLQSLEIITVVDGGSNTMTGEETTLQRRESQEGTQLIEESCCESQSEVDLSEPVKNNDVPQGRLRKRGVKSDSIIVANKKYQSLGKDTTSLGDAVTGDNMELDEKSRCTLDEGAETIEEVEPQNDNETLWQETLHLDLFKTPFAVNVRNCNKRAVCFANDVVQVDITRVQKRLPKVAEERRTVEYNLRRTTRRTAKSLLDKEIAAIHSAANSYKPARSLDASNTSKAMSSTSINDSSRPAMEITLQSGKWRKSISLWRRTRQTLLEGVSIESRPSNHRFIVRSSGETNESIACHRRSLYLQNISLTDSTVVDAERRSVLNFKQKVLDYCDQESPLPFSEVYSKSQLKECEKIGEGAYGEVFRYAPQDADTPNVVMKVIPIEGDVEINGEIQKTFEQILPEIVISVELSKLKGNSGASNSAEGFVNMQQVCCVQGKYPEHLLDLWQEFDETKGSENDNPEILPEKQLYIVLELEFAGRDMEAYVFNNAEQTYAALGQIVLTLAAAEQEYQFEHRDLHWGNVLISSTSETHCRYLLNGEAYQLKTKGIKTRIIDYTLSRITFDNCCLFNDLSKDEELFIATGDYQFDIYRMMRDVLKNNWELYEPKTNIFWISYIIAKMVDGVKYKNPRSKIHATHIKKLENLKDSILGFSSATAFAKYLMNDLN